MKSKTAYLVYWPQMRVFYMHDEDDTLRWAESRPTLFANKRLAEQAIKSSLEYSNLHNLSWKADEYQLVKVGVRSK